MPAPAKLRVVIDTNIIVSAMISSGGPPAKLLKLWKEKRFILVISGDLIEEITEVLRREDILDKYGLSPRGIFHLVTSLKLGAEMVTPLALSDLPINCRDPKDNILLALAFAAEADYLVTGDKDLLTLKSNKKLDKLKIATAKELLNLILPLSPSSMPSPSAG